MPPGTWHLGLQPCSSPMPCTAQPGNGSSQKALSLAWLLSFSPRRRQPSSKACQCYLQNTAQASPLFPSPLSPLPGHPQQDRSHQRGREKNWGEQVLWFPVSARLLCKKKDSTKKGNAKGAQSHGLRACPIRDQSRDLPRSWEAFLSCLGWSLGPKVT